MHPEGESRLHSIDECIYVHMCAAVQAKAHTSMTEESQAFSSGVVEGSEHWGELLGAGLGSREQVIKLPHSQNR